MSDDSKLGKGLLIGFLTGGIVGAVVALLYAPKSGKEFRQDIRVKSDEFLDAAERNLENAKEKAQSLINDGKKKSEKLIEDAKVKVDSLLKEAEKILHDAKEKTGHYVEDGKETIVKEGEKLKSAIKAGIETYKAAKSEKEV
ncbi:MAG: YtxH domain-containing protein [bacterium]